MQGKSEASSLEFTLIDPSGGKYQIRLSPADSPIDLKAYLSDFAPLSHYTNYHFESNKAMLQDYMELSEQPIGESVEMVLKPYNDRAFKQHIKRVKELLKHPASSYSHIVHPCKDYSQDLEGPIETQIPPFNMESLLLQPHKVLAPPSYLCPFTNDEDSTEIPTCLMHLSFSEFNPPSNKRKMQGDLGYIIVRTLEGNTLHITCACNGFYVNATDLNKGLFKPEPTTELVSGKTLVDLLARASLGFKNAWQKLSNIGEEWNTVRFLGSVVPTPAWCIDKEEEITECENLAMRDWNEEFQMVRSLPSESPLQRIQRDKALGKIYSDFLEVAINGAKSVISGCVQPLNPMDPLKQQLFVFNHIFFSFTEDLEYTVSCIQ